MWRSFSWRVSMSGIERWRGLARPSRLLAAGLVTLGVAGIALAADAAVSEGQVRALLKARLPKTVIGSVDCATRSEERRGGIEWFSTCRSRWWPTISKKTHKHNI